MSAFPKLHELKARVREEAREEERRYARRCAAGDLPTPDRWMVGDMTEIEREVILESERGHT